MTVGNRSLTVSASSAVGGVGVGPVAPTSVTAGLPLLLRLRWWAVPGQLLAWWALPQLAGVAAPTEALVVPLVVAGSNAAVTWGLVGRLPSALQAGGLIVLDTLLLTLWLWWAGGVLNPFTILFLVQIALAALVLGSGWTWAIAGLATACFGSLLALAPQNAPALVHDPVSHTTQLDVHLRGMWVAFVLAAILTAWFVAGLRRVLDRRERELVAERAERARGERLAALSTAVGSAAHELSTPLASVALAAGEIASRLADQAPQLAEQLAPELEALRSEAARCRRILDEMGERAGESRGEGPSRVAVDQLVAAALRDLGAAACCAVDVTIAPELYVWVPERAVTRALAALVRNASDAVRERQALEGDSPALDWAVHGAQIEVLARRVESWCDGKQPASDSVDARQQVVEIVVCDRGCGLGEEALTRAGEPFFTTKPAGRGLGLGLYVSRSLIEQLGGSLSLAPRAGGGAVVTVVLPLALAGSEPPAGGAPTNPPTMDLAALSARGER